VAVRPKAVCSPLLAGIASSNLAEVVSSLYDDLITHSEEFYSVCVCVCVTQCELETSTTRRPRAELGCGAANKNIITNKRKVFSWEPAV
jgi:hypothetical protein